MKSFSKVWLSVIALSVAGAGLGLSAYGNSHFVETKAASATDTITASNMGVSGSGYSTFSNGSSTSSASYAGNAAKDASGAFHFRATSPSGLVCCTSAGLVKTVSVSFDSSTVSGQILDIYGSNTAYTTVDARDLYSSSTQGTKVSSYTFVTGTPSYSYTFTSDYQYFGLRSNTSDGLYLTSISVEWSIADTPVTGISLSDSTYTGSVGTTKQLSVIYTPSNTTEQGVNWTTSDATVASVDTTGLVSLQAAGTATITATSNANTSLSASCVVTVAAAQNYHLVTALDQLVTGAKVIIASSATDGSAKVLGPQSGTYCTAVDATVASKQIATGGATIFTLGTGTTNTSYYTLKSTNGYLATTTTSKSLISSQSTSDVNSEWNISFNASTGVASMVATGSTNTYKTIQYNNSSPRFTCYTTTQQPVYLYEETSYFESYFVEKFNDALDLTCSNTAPTAITSTTWGALANTFANLSVGAKNTLKAVVTTSETDTAMKEAISRYDFVMGKAAYSSFSGFIGRFPSRSATPAATTSTTSVTDTLTPLIALIVTAGAISLFFLAKRKKPE